MKSERRHELEQNALADWMTDLVETTKPYANHIMVGVLVIALGLVAYTMWARNATSRTTDAWDAMLTSVISGKPSELEMTARRLLRHKGRFPGRRGRRRPPAFRGLPPRV